MRRHAGVRGNESADRLAGKATVEVERAMDLADILNAIREVEREKDANYEYKDAIVNVKMRL